jgi:hypothetical protein
MRPVLDEVSAPAGAIYRVGWHSDPLSPPPWDKALPDGTFDNRYDDPSAAEGRREAERFRCLYFGTTAAAAFGETLAGFRVPIDVLATFGSIEDDETLEEVLVGALVDPDDVRRGLVPAEWRAHRALASVTFTSSLRFANVATIGSQQYLRTAMAQVAARLGITDVDFSTMLNLRYRPFTQACARHIYDMSDRDGAPRFAGVRYLSRLNALEWECWALFSDRITGAYSPGQVQDITPDHPDLLRAAGAFNLTIEVGPGRYIRP